MIITATESKAHFGKYPELAKTEDIFFTKNNKKVAKLTAPSVDSKTGASGLALLSRTCPWMTSRRKGWRGNDPDDRHKCGA